MTNEQKVEELVGLLGNVIHTLNLKQYDIEDPTVAYQCEVEADQYYNQMLSIIHSND
jgi:hypothetical protein